jgi:hypothetical protein
MADAPRLFRVLLEVADLDKAGAFYSKLLDNEGEDIGGLGRGRDGRPHCQPKDWRRCCSGTAWTTCGGAL